MSGALRSSLIVLAAGVLSGCAAEVARGVIPEPAPLSLRRDRYVLPPEPPPPAPRPVDEMRRLEAEWPPVSPFSVRRAGPARAAPVEAIPECRIARGRSLGAAPLRPAVAAPEPEPSVIIRVEPAPPRALPEVRRERP